jgi:uncharacterized protein YjeT (DUF2065 family)
MITLVGIATIVAGILYFLACDNLGKTMITASEILVTRVILAAGIGTMSVGIALEFF